MGAKFDSGMMATGKTFEHTFTTAGEYTYFCTIHPDMIGKVIVS
jgi:plastocyanin